MPDHRKSCLLCWFLQAMSDMSVLLTGASAAKAAEPFQPLLLEAPKEWFAEEGAPLREEVRGRMCALPISPLFTPLCLRVFNACTAHMSLPRAYLDAGQRI